MKGNSFVASTLFGVGLLALFVGERLLASGTGRMIASGLGAALIALGVVLRVLRVVQAEGERRRAERSLLWLALVGVAALLLYVVQSDLWTKLADEALSRSSPKLAGALSALWPAVLALSVLPTFLVELAYAAMQRAPEIETGRIRDALLSGVGVTCAVVFSFCAYYVASERDVKWNFAHFRTAQPGEATRNTVRALDQKVSVAVFFPPANDVREHISEYLGELARESSQFELAYYDHALDPKKARELGVTGNGTIVVARGDRKELMAVGLELERAKTQLRGFDQEFQKRLLTIARAKKTIYFTIGHGERGSDRTAPTDQRWTIRKLRDVYGDNNFEVKNLGVAEGLASDVPLDAAAVVIAGPTEPFLAEELASIERYLARGGSVLLALDPEAKTNFEGLLASYGVRYDPTVLANDQVFLARTRQLSDRANIGTAAFSSHPSVTTLGRLGQRAPLLLIGAGSLVASEPKPDTRVDFTVHSHPSTWNDADGNFELTAPAESRRVFELAAAVTRQKTRMLVFADSDLLGDPVIENAGNAYLALDGMKWLLGEEAITGEVSSEEDVPIQHTRKQDVWWFYSTVFAAPALIIAFGMVLTRRRAQKRSSKEAGR